MKGDRAISIVLSHQILGLLAIRLNLVAPALVHEAPSVVAIIGEIFSPQVFDHVKALVRIGGEIIECWHTLSISTHHLALQVGTSSFLNSLPKSTPPLLLLYDRESMATLSIILEGLRHLFLARIACKNLPSSSV